MRNIPLSLKNKLSEKWHVQANDAQPNLRIVATQATSNTLISETIHENIPSDFGDVAIRQLQGEKTPSKVYALCIDSGTAKVYERNLPADLDEPWVYLWTLGSAKDVAIEFNGNWQLDASNQWYYLVTEEIPYLFWIGSDNALYVQKWNDAATKLQLDTSVSQISVCKGWRSSLMAGLDQGLIIGYLKSGKVYYRAYCVQDDGTSIWEPSYEVTELGTGNNSVSVFRTNDFRIGFITETGGEMKWVLSHRNYTGMSFRPETVNAQVQDVVCRIVPTNEILALNNESINTSMSNVWCLQYPTTAPTLAVTRTEKLNVDGRYISGFKLFLNVPIFNLPSDYASLITLTPTMQISSVSYSEADQAIIINLATNILKTVEVNISISATRDGYYFKHPNQKHPLEALAAFSASEAIVFNGFDNTTANVSINGCQLVLVNAQFNNTFETETASIAISSVAFVLVPVSSLPI
jgi:hypothetical protein